MAINYAQFLEQTKPTETDYAGIISRSLAARQGYENNAIKQKAAQMQLDEALRKQAFEQGLRERMQQEQANPTGLNPDFVSYDQFKNSATMGPPETINSGMLSGATVMPGQGATESDFRAAYMPQAEFVAKPPLRLKYEYAMQQGDTAAAQEAEKEALDRASKIATLTGNAGAAVSEYNKMMGTNLEYLSSKGNLHTVKEGEKLINWNSATGQAELLYDGGKKQGKVVDKTVDLGNKQRVYYSDNTYEDLPKTASPNTIIRVEAGSKKNGNKPMPIGAVRMQQDALDAIGLASNIATDLGTIKQRVDSGQLQLGPIRNALNTARNYAGVSNEESRDLATFKASLEKLRNDSLRLNKGVQTEGDAQRAWNELFANINDQKLVSRRLQEIQNINDRAVALQEMNIENIRSNYDQAPLNTTGYKTQPSAIGRKSTGKQSGRFTVEEVK